MNVKAKPCFLKGDVKILPSKSYVNRYLIASALADNPTEIVALTQADDICRTANCLRALGAEIDYSDGLFTVQPIGKNLKRNAYLNCHENGTLLRFIVPIAAALKADSTIDGTERLRERPIADLIECLKTNRLTTDGKFPLKLDGGIHAGEFKIKGSISSQFISGLLLALPLLNGDSKIIIEGELASVDYVNITLDVLQQFKITIHKTDYGFDVPGNQKYISPRSIVAEGDWSNAAFFLCAGAINGDITVKGLNANSKQGDKEILNILKKCGTILQINGDDITAKQSDLQAFEIDAKHIPDLVPIVSVLAANASGKTTIKNIERLKDKESDRLTAVLNMLTILGIKALSDVKDLIIHGGKLTGGTVDGANDHRIVMSATIAALKATSEITISDSHAINKSYPDFFKEFTKLGGIMR